MCTTEYLNILSINHPSSVSFVKMEAESLTQTNRPQCTETNFTWNLTVRSYSQYFLFIFNVLTGAIRTTLSQENGKYDVYFLVNNVQATFVL